jgi:transcriptional repressor NrdR
MFCINCYHSSTQVTNSRPHKKQPLVWRRRHCTACGDTFTTHERPSLRDNMVITGPSGSEPFNLGKLILSIARAFLHSERDAQYSSLWIAKTVEDTISTQLKAVTTSNIATITYQALKHFDEVAAVQYGAQHKLIGSAKRRGRPSLVWHEPPTDESPSR